MAGCKRALCLLLCLLALCTLPGGRARADLDWPEPLTAAQVELRGYTERVNTNLAQLGQRPVNSLFECWPTLAVLGITQADGAEVPEQVEITVHLEGEHIAWLELRVSDLNRFPPVAAALIQAAVGEGMSLKDAQTNPQAYLRRVQKQPDFSFVEEPVTEQGEEARTYWSYRINPYGDGVNWISMVLVFPWEYGRGSAMVTPVPEIGEEHRRSVEDESSDFEGYYQPLDEAEHFEIFVTPTPEPDSPVYDFR